MKQPAILFLALLLACWPVWPWYVTASMDASNDYAGLLAASTVAWLAWRGEPGRANDLSLFALFSLPMLLLVAYLVATLAGLPLALRAALAMLSVAAFLSRWRFGRAVYLPLFALSLLALPLAASLQFYLGYPLRVIAGSISAALLQANGFAVVREGTLLNWHGQLLAIDAPCSGVKMLWAALYLSYCLAAFYRLSTWRTLLAIWCAVVIVVLGNALRAAALFYSEGGLVKLPDGIQSWSHSGIGMMSFIAVMSLIVLANVQLQKREFQHA
jgi:exosortase